MKKKKVRKPNPGNSNQLSFDFSFAEPTIEVHLPHTNLKSFETHFTTTKRLAIKLAQN
jgi:hypothetical protein